MATKKIVVIYRDSDWKRDTPFDSIPTRESFQDWHERGLSKGIELYRASIKWFNKKKCHFTKGWAYRHKKWIKINSPIKPDLIFDKLAGKNDYPLFDYKIELSRKTKIFNHPLFRTILDNKLSQYLIFKDFMAFSFLATNQKEYLSALKKIKSSRVVIKPLYGSGGFGIIIETKQKAKKIKNIFPVLLQEFIVSNRGIPNFSRKNEVADLRMIFINHKFIYALSRIAKSGSLFTNFHQGAAALLVPEKNIPVSAKKMASKIIAKLKLFPEAHYSLDFMFTNSGKPVLVEMNTTPGFDLLHIVGDEKIKERNFCEFIKVLN
jgi:glutathione synthase/RimK-type ligase-like ATP-grasp enzyme